MAITLTSAVYTENFDILASSGTSAVLPTGWAFNETGTNANATYTAGTGSGNAGDTYSFGSAGIPERALGMLLSGSLNPTIGAEFTNATGSALSSLAIAYTGEQWRLGTAGRIDRIDFQYSLNATSLSSGTWVDFDLLDFVAPVATGAVGLRDGNAAGNRQSLSATIPGLSIPSGATFWIRWTDFNATGADDGLAVDDFSLSAGIDTGTPLVSVTATDASAAEGGDTGTLRISRTGPTDAALTVNFSLGGTAGAGDYAPALGTSVLIAAGASFVDLVITPVDDFSPEGAESLVLSLAAGAGYDLGSPAAGTVTIADNDTVPIRISAVQGNGSTSPIVGSVVTVEAIVVGDFQGPAGLGGFFLQEEDAETDADPNTSEGLFVFQGSSGIDVDVVVGNRVRVTGTVAEFGSAGATLTELTGVTAVTVTATSNPLPTPTMLTLPLVAPDALEPIEGMLVFADTTLTVTDTFNLQRFGEVLLAAHGPGNAPGTDARLDQFTQFFDPSVADNAAWQALQALRTIVLDDGSDDTFPPTHLGPVGAPLSAGNSLRTGDLIDDGLAGVLDQRFGSYRVQPTGTVAIAPANERPTSAPDVGGSLQVASLNVLNFFNGDGLGGGFPTARGATNATELARQRAKIVSAILGTGAEVVGVLEIENDGFGSTSAIQELVNALNAASAPGTWAFIDPGRSLGTDAIAVGLLYQPGVVRPVGSAAVLDSAVDPRFDSSSQRPSLAQTFEVISSGALFTPVINHLKSKGTSAGGPGDADSGDGQGLSNGTRTRAAEALVDWLATNPTGAGDGDYLILGDLNAYLREDPVSAIRSGADDAAGTDDDYTPLIGEGGYSFSFDGAFGALDHALASQSLLGQVTGAAEWHINADEPTALDYNTENDTPAQLTSYYAPDAFRASDHDPLIVGLELGAARVGTARGDLLTGTPGPDRITGGGGRDLIVPGAGADVIVYTSLLDLFDTVIGFERFVDRLDIDALMATVAPPGTDPVAGGYLRAVATSVPLSVPGGSVEVAIDTLVLFDPDGSSGPAEARPLVDLIGVSIADVGVLIGRSPI